jgi:phosphoribosylglycinamide formyltransferase 1
MLKIGFFASHNGSNMQAIIDAINNKQLEAIPAVVISNNSDSLALKRAKMENIPYYHLSSKKYPDDNDLDNTFLDVLIKHEVDIIILAGYMKKIGKNVLRHYKNKILNIHPALLPKHGGSGMYGLNVHKAVLDAKEKFTGITIHLVDGIYDHGKIINQMKIPIYDNDTVETLSKRVLENEHKFYVETLKKIINNEIKLEE